MDGKGLKMYTPNAVTYLTWPNSRGLLGTQTVVTLTSESHHLWISNSRGRPQVMCLFLYEWQLLHSVIRLCLYTASKTSYMALRWWQWKKDTFIFSRSEQFVELAPEEEVPGTLMGWTCHLTHSFSRFEDLLKKLISFPTPWPFPQSHWETESLFHSWRPNVSPRS